MKPAVAISMIKETLARFGSDNASTYAAAIAYAGVFSLAPLIIIAVAIAGSVLGIADGGHGHHIIEDQLINALARDAGKPTAETVRSIVDATFSSHQSSMLAQTIGWATFALAASGVFLTIQTALNVIWRAQTNAGGWLLTLRHRLVSGLMLLLIGVVVLAAVCINIGSGILLSRFAQHLPPFATNVLPWVVAQVAESAIIAVLFGMIYKILPDTRVAWGDVRVGAIVTAVLFVVGQALLSVYIAHAGIENGYGAAGSLVVLLVWVYYSALLFLIGAEFSSVYAAHHGSRAEHSVPEAPLREAAA